MFGRVVFIINIYGLELSQFKIPYSVRVVKSEFSIEIIHSFKKVKVTLNN